eukprot:m.13551 g.13551  ORF g.13551 m.13551 type:complete len:877 (-) comp4878_c0_seq1:93-2723(-)
MPGGMQKARQYNISETNISGLGTPLEQAIRKAAADGEDAWKSINPKKVGVRVWRIEKFLVKPWPKRKYGKFFNGDSYIVLNTYHKKGGKGGIHHDVHFWIGSQSTQDEYGTAAYKTVELDDYLGGAPDEYRETEGNESKKFKSLFKRLVIMEGGIESGFEHVEEEVYEKQLLWIKGNMGNIVVRKVPLSWESLNSGDSFVLCSGNAVKDEKGKVKEGFTDGKLLLIFHGSSASPMEKVKAAGIAQSIDDERGGEPERETFHDGHMSDEELKLFWEHLGSKPPRGTKIKTAEEGGADDATKDVNLGTRRLLKVSDESGKIKMTELATGADLSRSMVTSDDAFILDDGTQVMVWIGKDASRMERKKAMEFGQQYINDYNIPDTRVLCRIMDGGDNEQFEQAFEVGVMSMGRPEDGTKFTGNIDKIRGLQKTKAAAASVSATYKGSGGPGVAVDFDALYQQPCADPKEWRGRTKPESSYSKEMQEKRIGAYNAETGWVSSLTKAQRESRQKKLEALETKYMKEGAGGGAVHCGASDVLTSGGTEGSLTAAKKFDPVTDALALRDAMKGLGTRKQPLIEILTSRSVGQRLQIRQAFEEHPEIAKDIFKTIEGEWMQVGGNFERVLKVLLRDPYERDAHFLYKAIRGLRPDTTLVLEILCTQESSEITKIAEAYKLMTAGKSLEEDIAKEYSNKKYTRELLLALISGKRPGPGAIDQALAKEDAKRLYEAGEKRTFSSQHQVFVEILSQRSYGHILAVVDAYANVSPKGTPLLKAVARNNSGSARTALKTIVSVAEDPTSYYCDRLHKALEGQLVGTHDHSLIRIIVSRAEVDLMTIETIYAARYGTTLQDDITHKTSKAYMKTLLHLVIGNKGSEAISYA